MSRTLSIHDRGDGKNFLRLTQDYKCRRVPSTSQSAVTTLDLSVSGGYQCRRVWHGQKLYWDSENPWQKILRSELSPSRWLSFTLFIECFVCWFFFFLLKKPPKKQTAAQTTAKKYSLNLSDLPLNISMWLRARLISCGQISISPSLNVANLCCLSQWFYVMHAHTHTDRN